MPLLLESKYPGVDWLIPHGRCIFNSYVDLVPNLATYSFTCSKIVVTFCIPGGIMLKFYLFHILTLLLIDSFNSAFEQRIALVDFNCSIFCESSTFTFKIHICYHYIL